MFPVSIARQSTSRSEGSAFARRAALCALATALSALVIVGLSGCAFFRVQANRPAQAADKHVASASVPKAAVRQNVEQATAKPAAVGDREQKGGLAEKSGDAAGASALPANPARTAEKSAEKGPSDSAVDEPRFKKHNHAQYLYEIKKKAIDVVNKHESSADLVVLCQDSATDQWSLTAYRKDRKSYSFVVYSWDPVDGRFKESMQSGNLPIARWKHHLKFSRSGKKCSVLKGSDR